MSYKNINLPATVIHTVNEKQYTINGTLKSINESKGVCTVAFGDRICRNIPLDEVYLNEGIMDVIKAAGKKVADAGKALFKKITNVIKKIKGFIFPTDIDGTPLTQFVNAPCNVANMVLPDSIESAQSPLIELCNADNGMSANGSTIDDLMANAEQRDIQGIEKYWSRVMEEYIKPENESLSLETVVKMVNEKYYRPVISNNVLNEACARTWNLGNVLNESGAIPSIKALSSNYGTNVTTRELIGRITTNIREQLEPPVARRAGEGGQAKPLIIWGAPGIGKTAILSEAMDLVKDQYRLTMHTMKCAALKFDDFELPDTVKNIVGQKLAVSNPKTWLPVYNPHGLTKAQIELTDKIYNTGVYKIYQEDEESSYTNSEGDEKGVTIHHIDADKIERDVKTKSEKIKDYIANAKFDGGILFFDEFSRLNPNVTDIMMNLMGERIYGENFVLATKWCTIGAANRLSDDFKAEDDSDFREIWGAAKDDRYQHYNYVPTKAEWLDWARKPNKITGIQNISERFCSFIEKAPEYVWYATLENGGQNVSDETVANALKHAGHMTKAEQDAIGQYITSCEDIEQTRLGNIITPRTWDEKVNRKVISQLIYLLGRDTDLYNSIFTTHEYKTREQGIEKTYVVKDVDEKLLAAALEQVDKEKWDVWADGSVPRVDAGEKFVHNPKKRIMFWNGWIDKVVVPEALGELSNANKYYQTFADPEEAYSIWKTGEFNSKNMQAEDALLFNSLPAYTTNTSRMSWKSDTEDANNYIKSIIEHYPGSLIDDIVNDAAELQKITNMDVTDADMEKYGNMFKFTYVEDDEEYAIDIYDGRIAEADYKQQIFLLKHSLVARQFLNISRWICRVVQQTSVGSIATSAQAKLLATYNKAIKATKASAAKTYLANSGNDLYIPGIGVLTVFEKINI